MSVPTRSPSPARDQPRVPRRLLRWTAANPLAAVAIVVVASLAAAAITVTYTTSSTLTTGVTAAPIQFQAGDDAGPSVLGDFVTAYAISGNATYVTASIKGVPESTLTLGSFVKIRNVDDEAHAVTLATTQVSNAYVTGYTLALYDGSNALAGTLNLTSASPTVTVTIPAGSTYTGRLVLSLATGAGANNVALSNGMSLSFT